MPRVEANGISINYEQQGSGEPLILIPYLTADNACYAFQIPEYAKYFRCIAFDPRGAGETDKPRGTYTTELFAEDLGEFMQALQIDRAHIYGMSLGAGVGLCFAAKYPEKVISLSVHGGWTRTDAFLETVIEGWQIMAKALGSVHEMTIKCILPWCLTPDLYAKKPEFLEQIIGFIRSRPEQPVAAFIQQTEAILAHDIESQLGRITAPTQITFGEHDMITSVRFADPMTSAIANTELIVFDDCAHAPLYEKIAEFNQKTLAFLRRHSGQAVASSQTI